MRRNGPTRDEAEALALQGLTFLTSDGQRLARFLSLTGMAPTDLRSWAGAPHLQAAVLDYLLGDESLLLVFAAEARIDPVRIAPARDALNSGSDAGPASGRGH